MRRFIGPMSIALWLLTLPGCGAWFFTGERGTWVDRSRPVALLETTGGVELAATTEAGILSLGRTATDGPCRVHYFLGPTPLIESGELRATGTLFTEAVIDLKTQLARILDRPPGEHDDLFVMWTRDGEHVERVTVERACGEGLSGDLLHDPGTELPAGATVLCRDLHGKLMVAGLIAGRATVDSGPTAGRYYVYAGVDRLRELLAQPEDHPVDMVPKYRADDISVLKPAAPAASPGGAKAGAADPGGSNDGR